MKITKLTPNTKISDFTILSKLILCNKSTHLELYTLTLDYISTIPLEFYTLRIIKYTEDILILVGKDRYSISVIENTGGSYSLYQIGYQMASLSHFTHYHVWLDLVILYSLKSFKIYHFRRDRLAEDDLPNDFDFFSMLHLDFCGGTLNIVVKDIEDTTYLLRYNTTLALNRKLKKACTAIFSYGQGYIYLNEGIVWYELNNKKVAESEFGNIRVVSSIVHKTDLILSMENDELIKISVENENTIRVHVFKMNTFENLHLAGDLILGHTTCGMCNLFRIINNKVEIIQNIESIIKLNKSLYTDKRIIFYNDKFQSILSNFQVCETKILEKKVIDETGNLESFYFFNDIFIGVYENHTEFKNLVDGTSDFSPLNHKAMGFYTYNDALYFYTSFTINKLTKFNLNEMNFKDEILLCSFYQHKFVCYTTNGKLQTKLNSVDIVDISCILYHDDLIYASTYNDKFIVYDNLLTEISSIDQTTFILGCVYRNCIYFCDVKNSLYYSCSQGKDFSGGEKYDGVTKLIANDRLFLISKYTVLYYDEDQPKLLLDIRDIKDIVHYKDDYYMLVKNNIYKTNFISSDYKYTHDLNSLLYMHKQDSRMFSVDLKGQIHYKKFNFTINNLIKAEYKNKEYTLLTDTKIYRFNTKTKSVSQESTNKKLIDMHGRVKVSYNELFIDKECVKYNRGLIRNCCIKDDMILIIDYFYGYHIYDFKEGWINKDSGFNQDSGINKDSGIKRKQVSKKKYYSGYIWKKKIILSDEECVTVLDIETGENVQLKVDEKITCYCEDTLEINKEVLYCVTEGNSVWKLE